MDTNMNTNQDLTIESGAYKLGEHFFQSFLLAGERYLNSGLAREGTDEVRFGEFYGALQSQQQHLLKGYFKRQATLDLAQRVSILPEMVPLRIQDPLTFATTTKTVATSPSMRTTMNALAAWKAEAKSLAANRPTRTTARAAATPDYNRLVLRLEEVQVTKAQDKVLIFDDIDEVLLAVVTIDETGDVKRQSHNIGAIKEGQRKNFGNFRLTSFNLTEGGADRWPKSYTAHVYAIERDNGGYNDLLDHATDFIKEKITEELIALGITAGSTAAKYPIPPEIARIVANVAKGFFDNLVDWLAGLLFNADDLLGQQTQLVTLQNFNDGWGNTNSNRSPAWRWTFTGADGRWVTRMHWLLEKSGTPES